MVENMGGGKKRPVAFVESMFLGGGFQQLLVEWIQMRMRKKIISKI